ncbi:MAG: type I phosphomannose isomerase catalytic subunit [Lachnospiraceae bacterium]
MKREGFIFLKPVFKEMIWGGNRLATEFGYDIPGDDTGECWGISAHPNGDCTVINGKYAGMKLSQLWNEHPELFGKEKVEGVFPLLTKIIDAKADLSIQVHPSDDYAKVNENGSLGKTECWYILDCPEGATLVVGHNAKDKEECAKMIHEGRWSEFIREVPIRKGDFVSIVPGTVHAIKAGVMLLETQQNSDITYRVYDYDRLSNGKKRELHIEKSIDVINAPASPAQDSIHNFANVRKNKPVLMEKSAYYKVWKLVVEDGSELQLSREKDFDSSYLLASVVAGSGYINDTAIKKGDHFIVTNECDSLSFSGDMEIILSAQI